MQTPVVVEPFAFFTWDALRAGWYLTWRLLVRLIPLGFVVGIVVALLGSRTGALAGFLFSLGLLAAVVWSITLIPKLTSQWAQERYGQALDGALAVWWGITWRSLAVSVVAAVVMAVPNVVALSLKTAYPGSPLGAIGGLIVSLLNLANLAVTVLATGWAMSRVAAAQIVSVAPVAAILPPPIARSAEEAPWAADVAVAREPTPSPRPASDAAPTSSPAPVAVSGGGKLQCPKCGLYETERGSVIGWYCKVCGWREVRK
jgi:hypothetical protein